MTDIAESYTGGSLPPTPTTSPGSGCQVTWSVVNSWSGGFQLGFTVTNSGTAQTTGWNVSWSWPGAQAVTQIWNASDTQSGTAVTTANLSYNGAIPAKGSTTSACSAAGTHPPH